MRFRHASGDDSEREDKPEQGLHLPDDTADPRQTQVERVLVSGVTSKVFTRDELAAAFENVRADGRPGRRRPATGMPGSSSTPPTSLHRARGGHHARPRRGAGLDLEDDGDLPRQPHDVVPVAVVGHRRADRPDHLRAGQPDARPRRRHHHQRDQHLDHHLRRRRPVVPPGGHLQPAAVRVRRR